MSHRTTRVERPETHTARQIGKPRTLVAAALSVLMSAATVAVGAPAAHAALPFEVPSLDGRGNNVANPNWGRAGQQYSRVGTAHYADGRSAPLAGPKPRYVSNRIFNDDSTNIFSEHRASGWAWTWGQFIDHTIGLKQGSTEPADIPFDANDPMESYRNDFGVIQMTRAAAAPGTGVDNPRQQINTENSYIDAEAVYSNSPQRLEWLRDGSLNNNPADNAATLMLPGGYLPTAESRGNPAAAPGMDVDGPLRGTPNKRYIAGDPRANENLNLASTQTLFAREHNRIVAGLPRTLTAEEKFQIARRVVIAEQQYITYNEFLPSVSVKLPAYTGYKPNVNASISNEFAAVGYRMHSMIHSETEIETHASRYTEAQLREFESMGIEVERLGDEVAVVLPLGQSFFNPTLLPKLQLGAMLQAIGNESQYRNDEQMANALRSVLFQVPVPGNPTCIPDVPEQPQCFRGVSDLAAIDIQRPYDHGVGTYNDLRRAYGLAPVTSWTQLTGESTDQFPRHASLTRGREIDDPNSLDFVAMSDIDGAAIDLADTDAVEGTATAAVRRTTLAARLKAIYGTVD
ncbi:MAG TPA: peroxidase family protein, partial [Actinoplanes sp.]